MDQIASEHVYPPSLSRVEAVGGEESRADQPINHVREPNKPSLMNTFSMIVVLLAILLTLSFVVLTLSTLAGLQLGNTLLHPNPFTAYEALWPGQSIASLSAYARQTTLGQLSCISASSPHDTYAGLSVQVAPETYSALGQTGISCTDYPKNGFFRALSVIIENNRIQQLVFYSGGLREDVLLLYWGMPDSITQSGNPQIVNLYWDRSSYSTMASVMKSDSVVKRITLTAREWP